MADEPPAEQSIEPNAGPRDSTGEAAGDSPPATTVAAAGDGSTAATAMADTPGGRDRIEEQIVEALKTVFDPEIPVNIYEMGLIYDVGVEPTGEVAITMTLTSPGCPVAGSLPIEVQTKVERIPGVTAAKIDLVWEPAWNPSMMSEAAKLQLGMF
jgi:FeS assembly SUF system protein